MSVWARLLGPSPGTPEVPVAPVNRSSGAPDKEPQYPVKRILISAAAGIAMLVAVSACTTEDVSKSAIQTYFPEQYDKALSVATCESGLDLSLIHI